MENNNVITIEKEIYGWNINDIGNIIKESFISILPEELKNKFEDDEDFSPAEGYCFDYDELYVEGEYVPEFVNTYMSENKENQFMVQSLGIDIEDECLIINVITTFQPREDEGQDGRNHDNRLITIELSNDSGETLYKVNYVK